MIISLFISLVIITSAVLFVKSSIKAVLSSKQRQIYIISGLLFLVTIIAGIRVGVYQEFALSPNMHIQGLPIPLVIFVREENNWTDFIKPRAIGYICITANILFPVGCAALIWRGFLLKVIFLKRKQQSNAEHTSRP